MRFLHLAPCSVRWLYWCSDLLVWIRNRLLVNKTHTLAFLAQVPEPSLNTVAKWLKLSWSWNVTVFSIPLTLESADIHKSAQGWSSRMTLEVLLPALPLSLCGLQCCAATVVCPYTCSSILLCSSNSTWQMQWTRKKIKGSSKAKNMCFSQLWGLISVAFPCATLTCLFCRDCVPFHAQGLVSKPQKRSHRSSWSKVFCKPSFKH